ncbi:MAG: hypothetical protein RLZZ230_239 [Candidatus Parcubacteria bacterium]|jgi:hypothetical protein
MKRPIFIIVGTVVVILLLAVWAYILFFSTPKTDNGQFTALNIDGNTESVIDTSATGTEPIVNVISDKKLIQLTTKPTAGYRELITTGSSSSIVMYIKSGTGNIGSIDLTTGEERDITTTTINFARQGEITGDGKFVMVQSESGNKKDTVVGTINDNDHTLTLVTIDEQVVSFKALDSTFLYAVRSGSSVVGKEYNPTTNTSKNLFTIPFIEAAIVWGNSATDVHYAYPKASSQLEGYAYLIQNGKVQRQPISGYGLSMYGNSKFLVYSIRTPKIYQSYLYDMETKLVTPTSFTFIPEKCTSSKTKKSVFICGEDSTTYSQSVPDTWYQGVTAFSDMLWELDINANTINLLSDVSKESGRGIDIIDTSLNAPENHVYFINKNDQTLWLYKRDIKVGN